MGEEAEGGEEKRERREIDMQAIVSGMQHADQDWHALGVGGSGERRRQRQLPLVHPHESINLKRITSNYQRRVLHDKT